MAAIEALVTPQVLSWARQQAGYTVGEVASWLHRKVEEITAWERGELRPTLAQARKLAHRYRRSLGDLYLDQPPSEPAPPADFRSGPWAADRRISSQVSFEVRRIHAMRDAAVELGELNEVTLRAFPVQASSEEHPEEVARRLRDALKVSLETQTGWGTPDAAWKGWRSAVEHLGALVFVVRDLDPRALGGFSLAAEVAPVIAINGKDVHHRKLFTLMHELVHLALRQDGVCDLREDGDISPASIEVFCNAVAAAILMPAETITAHPLVHGRDRHSAWSDQDLGSVASFFRVSPQAALRRMVSLNLTSWDLYRRWCAEHPFTPQPRDPDRKGGAFYNTYIHDTGMPYLALVFDAFHARRIHVTNVCDYLGHKVSTVKGIEKHYIDQVLSRRTR